MQIVHDSATSIATDEGVVEKKHGVFEVAEEVGERLIRALGFRRATADDVVADEAPKAEKAPRVRKPKGKTDETDAAGNADETAPADGGDSEPSAPASK